MRIKYPRTFHVPSSPGCTSDDKKLKSIDSLDKGLYLITEKMDGKVSLLDFGGFRGAKNGLVLLGIVPFKKYKT